MHELLLPILCGIIVGFSLGLTGGGGSIFAVPLLVYVIQASVRESVVISLAVVGTTALFGALLRAKKSEIEWKTGLIFAAAGMLAAPIGTKIASYIPDAITLAIFALLMGYVGWRMWRGGTPKIEEKKQRHCARCDAGKLILTKKCFLVLTSSGILAGILAGIFGVGGGFIIVPALILVTAMPIHRAVTTSLIVIALICTSGIISSLAHGEPLPAALTTTFVLGGLIGMTTGVTLRSKLPERTMRRAFAIAMWGIAIFILTKNIITTKNQSDTPTISHVNTEQIFYTNKKTACSVC